MCVVFFSQMGTITHSETIYHVYCVGAGDRMETVGLCVHYAYVTMDNNVLDIFWHI